MTHAVAVLPGDGVGPEVTAEAVRVLEAVGAGIELLAPEPIGMSAKQQVGEYLPQATLDAVDAADAVLFGAITSPLASEDPSYKSVILALRSHLDAYANVRPARDFGQPCLVPGVDLVIVRENTEGMYNCPEEIDAEGVTTLRRVSRRGCDRITRYALDYAATRNRAKVTLAHKANVLRASDGLLREVFRANAAAHGSGIVTDEGLVDAVAMQIVTNPARFDVIVTLNLYGDILSDVAAGVAGGLGFAPSGSIGDAGAIFEPVHGSAPDIAGKGIANPCGAILSAAMLLDHLGFPAHGARVENAVRAALGQGATRDAGGTLSTRGFGELVVKNLA